MTLRRVVLQVVEFQRSVLLDGYAFPVAFSRCPLLARKFPVEQSVVGVDGLTVLVGLFAVEEGQDVDAAVALRQCLFRTGKGCEGGHHIREVDDVVERLHGYAVGLVHDERHADAAVFRPGRCAGTGCPPRHTGRSLYRPAGQFSR